MLRRPDLVLVAMPVLALGGVIAERFVPLVAATVGTPLGNLPLSVLGVVGAVVVMLYALVWLPRSRAASVRTGDR